MVETITLIIVFIWVPQAIYQILNWTYWWQVKEYRLDRFSVFLRTYEGRNNLLVNYILLKFILLLFSLSSYFGCI